MSNNIPDGKESVDNNNKEEDVFRKQEDDYSTTATASTSTRSYRPTTAGRIKEPREGHSRKSQKILTSYRRDLVFNLSTQGYNQPMIANKLRVSQAVVSLDIAFLRKQAAESLSNFLSHKLPLIYQECYESIAQVIARSWELFNDKATPTAAKIALLSLIKDATESKMELSSGGEIIEQGINYAQAQNIKNRFVEITKTNDLLHPPNSYDENGDAVTTTNDATADDNNFNNGEEEVNDNIAADDDDVVIDGNGNGKDNGRSKNNNYDKVF